MITFIAIIIAIVGAINWLLIGIFDFNIVAWIFGANLLMASRIIYTIVGLSGLWLIGYLIKRGGQIIDNERKSTHD